MSKKNLIEINNLSKHFKLKHHQVLKAVDGVSIEIYQGETFGLVGESGSGKSTLGRTLTRLYEPTGGEIIYQGTDISTLKGNPLKKFQKKMQIIFQDPYSSLNPSMTVEEIIMEPIKIHTNLSRVEAIEKIKSILIKVGLSEDALYKYPHEFSGGQRQRIGIARALSVDPDFILCDEPISALDVSVQAQIVNTLKDIQRNTGVTYLFVAHDLSMVRYISDRVGIMYLGNIVEVGSSDNIYNNPKHPYTKILLSSIPKIGEKLLLDNENTNEKKTSLVNDNCGCLFFDRCPSSFEKCGLTKPLLQGEKHQVACYLYE